MIPFGLSPLFLFLPLGMLAAAILLIWLIRLAIFPRVRTTFKQHIDTRLPLVVLLGAFISIGGYVLLLEWQVGQKIAEQEAKENPTLTKPTTLAGIMMPAGTKLELLSANAVGERSVKPEYFERAEFPQPVIWRGLYLKSMHRRLDSVHCFEKHNYDVELCETLPAQEREPDIYWGWYLDTELAKPAQINGFYCKGQVHWSMFELPASEQEKSLLQVSAALPAPEYGFSSCTAAAGNEFQSKNGFLRLRLPENSHIFSSRLIGDSFPNGHLDVWTANDYGGEHTDVLTTSLFTFQPQSWDLNPKHDLRSLSGKIIDGTAECPLIPDSFVEWHHKHPNILKVQGNGDVKKCGGLTVKYVPSLDINI